MPSYQHELLLLLFRNHCASALELLRELDVELPDYDDVRTESADINDVRPAEYRADLVLFLERSAQKVLGVILEVQLQRDGDEVYSWPAYVANLRARYRCPVCLLVFTLDEGVSRWAGKSIDLGPGTGCTPWVVGLSNIPAVTSTDEAMENVELAVLSAIGHGGASSELAARVIGAALAAISSVDDERARLYLELLSISLPQNAAEEPEGEMLNSLGFEYQSAFARRYVAQGLEEGRKEGRSDVILKLLARRFGPLPEEIQTRVRSAPVDRFDILAERVLTA
jgi:hypothetical protein